MNGLNTTQVVITALLSSGVIGGLFTLFTKLVWSPESRNDLAKLGNDFASQLLQEAKVERSELRLTIRELEQSIATKEDTIARLKRLAADKDRTINELENQQMKLAKKVREGLPISLQDIFGRAIPNELYLDIDDPI